MNISQIREALKDRRLYVVSSRTGISYSTLNKIMRGYNTTANTMNKLEEYLSGTNSPTNAQA